MKKMFTMAAIAAMAAAGTTAQAQEIAYDFIPELQQIIFQEIPDSETGELVSQVRIDVKFSEDVWWVSGFSQQCYLLDSEGNKYENWTPDFSGPASDYTAFYFGVNGLNKYLDASYTLVVPQGLMGNTAWYSNADGSMANPELKYEFNAWELAGKPREDKTVYDFDPVTANYALEEVRINGQKQLELQLTLDFSEAVAISDNFNNKWSVYAGEDYLNDAIVRAWVNEENPNQVIVGLRGVDLKTSVDYRMSIWSGSFGTLEWAAEDYCEGRANSPLEYIMNPKGSGIDGVASDVDYNSPVYNMMGVQVDPSSLAKGIYIRDGKKFVQK